MEHPKVEQGEGWSVSLKNNEAIEKIRRMNDGKTD